MPALAARIVSQFSELDDVTLTSAARGDVLYRNATEWVNLAPGTDGRVLTTHGAGADPTWEAISAADLSTAVILAPTTDARNVIVPTADTVRALAVRRFSGTHSENLFEALDESGAALASIDASGRGVLGAGGAIGGPGNTAALTVNVATSGKGLIIRLGTTPNFESFSIRDSADLRLLSMNFNGDMVLEGSANPSIEFRPRTGATRNAQFSQSADTWIIAASGVGSIFELDLNAPINQLNYDSAGNLKVGTNSAMAARLHLRGTNAAHMVLEARAHASQSANIFEGQSSGGTTVYGTMSENGYWTTRKVAAPADGELSNSEASWWFDDTPGSAKLMVKAKNSSGTVVTGSVTLT